ncbi:MAG: hypothetical protein F6J87_18920 [Spirulina sp. SIO3F2]|nr:hypothetical protein [Spirulina sp. SIO3F2]
MSEPVTRAFVIGKVLATVLREKAEETVTDLLSDVGRFEAEQRENLRQFTEEVLARAEQELQTPTTVDTNGSTTESASPTGDLQETIDELRAEIAELRSALKAYRSAP